jgi:hypothetical protein
VRLLLDGQLRERWIVDAEDRIGDVDEAQRRAELSGERGIGVLEPVHGFMKVGVDVDDAHGEFLDSFSPRRTAGCMASGACVCRSVRRSSHAVKPDG